MHVLYYIQLEAWAGVKTSNILNSVDLCLKKIRDRLVTMVQWEPVRREMNSLDPNHPVTDCTNFIGLL